MTPTANFRTDDDQDANDALFKGIADAVPGLLYIIDLREMKMTYANQQVFELFGRTLGQMAALGPKFFDLIVYPPDRADFDAHIAELLSAPAGHVAELSFRVLDSKNEPIWLRTRRSIFQWDSNGRPTHVISVSQNISKEVALRNTNERLAEDRQQLKDKRELEVLRNIFSDQEEERDSIAESIHNGLGQLFYGVKLRILALERDPEKDFRSQKQYILDLLEEGIGLTRKISHKLLPIILNDFGLGAAIEDFYKKMNSTVKYSLRMPEGNAKAPQYIELAVFRIVQELIYYVQGYTQATTCMIEIIIGAQHVAISVSDNGEIGTENPLDLPGLRAVRDRVSLLKGTTQFGSEGPQNRINIRIPYLPPTLDS